MLGGYLLYVDYLFKILLDSFYIIGSVHFFKSKLWPVLFLCDNKEFNVLS